MGDDVVDLELELGAEVDRQRLLVDEVARVRDEQHTGLDAGMRPFLLRGADSVPDNARHVPVDDEPAWLFAPVEALRSPALEEDHLGGAGIVAAVRLRGVDVRRVDAADVADVRQQLMRSIQGARPTMKGEQFCSGAISALRLRGSLMLPR